MPPRLARLLAVLAAVVLVGGAFVARGALSGDDDTSTTGPDDPRATDDGAPLRILCDTDLGAVCASLAARSPDDEVETVPARDALTRLTSDDQTWDAWLTLDPWPEILTAAAGPNRPLIVTDPVPVASGLLAVLVDPNSSECTGATDWDCLSAPANPPVGLAHPTTAFGALVLAHAATALQEQPDFGINQLDDDVRVALESLLGGVRADSGRTVADQSDRIRLSGYFSAVIAPVGRAEAVASSAQGQSRDLVVADLAPEVTIGVVLAGIGPRGQAALDALEDVTTDQTVGDALAGEGWTGPAQRTAGLPDPGLIYALQKELA